MKKIYVACCSGGKDSTAMLLLLLKEKKPIDFIIFNDTGAEYEETLTTINQIKQIIPPTIPFITTTPKYTIPEYLTIYKRPKGKYQGKPYYWPTFKHRWCTGRTKQEPLTSFLAQFKKTHEVVLYIGFDILETNRAKNIINKNHFIKQPHSYIFPLIEHNYTSQDCLNLCYEHNITWNNAYNYVPRLSCFLCPLQSRKNMAFLIYKHPHLWNEIKNIETSLKLHYPDKYKFTTTKSAQEIENYIITKDRYKKMFL